MLHSPSNQEDSHLKAVANTISGAFKTAFTSFGNCHKIFNKCHVIQEELDVLGVSQVLTNKLLHMYISLPHLKGDNNIHRILLGKVPSGFCSD